MKVAFVCAAALAALTPLSARAAAPETELKVHVLQIQDLPEGFKAFSSFRRTAKIAADDSGSRLSDYSVWGFRSGWEAIFVPSKVQIRIGSAVVPGPQAIWASAEVYRDLSGAEHAFAFGRSRCILPPPPLRMNQLPIGDEARLCRLHASFGGNPPPGAVPYAYGMFWRRGHMLGGIWILALKGGTPPNDLIQLAVALAKKQDKRMA